MSIEMDEAYEKRKKSYMKSGDGYNISVSGCNNPRVNKDYYWGPLLYSAGTPNGIQIEETVYQTPIMGESSNPIARFLGHEEVVGYKTVDYFAQASPFLSPNLCPDEAKKAGPRGRFIYLGNEMNTQAKCVNTACPFNEQYKPRTEKKRSSILNFLHKPQ